MLIGNNHSEDWIGETFSTCFLPGGLSAGSETKLIYNCGLAWTNFTQTNNVLMKGMQGICHTHE